MSKSARLPIATISHDLARFMATSLSTTPVLIISRNFVALTTRIWHADKAGDDLPLLHRLAIIYLMVPLIIWLVGWFNWWFGIPAAVLIILAFRPALSRPTSTVIAPADDFRDPASRRRLDDVDRGRRRVRCQQPRLG